MTTTAIAGSSSTGSSSTTTSQSGLASNFETFLSLLTTQLKNQDPLSPMDTDKFTSQLVQFAGVEQQLKTNSSLTNLVSLLQTNTVGTALGFLGAEVSIDGSRVALDSSGATTYYNLAKDAQTAIATVYNASGNKIHSAAVAVGAGDQSWGWNGKLADGTSAAAGLYRVEITAVDARGQEVAVDMARKGVVGSVDSTGTTPMLVIDGKKIPLEAVTGVNRSAT